MVSCMILNIKNQGWSLVKIKFWVKAPKTFISSPTFFFKMPFYETINYVIRVITCTYKCIMIKIWSNVWHDQASQIIFHLTWRIFYGVNTCNMRLTFNQGCRNIFISVESTLCFEVSVRTSVRCKKGNGGKLEYLRYCSR